MRILVLGAYGFIGSEIVRQLLASGHTVVAAGRDTFYGTRLIPAAEWVRADLSYMTSPEQWRPLLKGVDAIVNASGLLQSGDGGSVKAVQFDTIAALVDACLHQGVQKFVQISATGAEVHASTDFMRTKGEADALLLGSKLPSVVLRPGLVIGRNSYGGAELIRSAAVLPVTLKLPFRSLFQCIALSDVVAAVEVALAGDAPAAEPIDLVERCQRPITEIVATYRSWLAVRPARASVLTPRWPLAFISRVSDALGHLGWRSPLRRNALLALEAGATGDAEVTANFLGREPLTLIQALSASPAGKQDRLAARLSLLAPAIMASLFLMWFASGVATLVQPDAAEAALAETALSPETRRALIFAGAGADILLALALLWRPLSRAALAGMIVLTLCYLVSATFLTPQLWADPLAPLAKAIPAGVLAVVAFWLTEKR